ARHVAPLPQNATPEAVSEAWLPLMVGAFTEGVQRAIAGDPGTQQDDAQSSYGAQFSEDEQWLRWDAPMRVLQRQATALNLFGPPVARALIAGQPHLVARVDPRPDVMYTGAPGDVIAHHEGNLLIGAADGAVQVAATPTDSPA